MDVHDETRIIDSCYVAGWENIIAIFLGVKNTFSFTWESSYAMTSSLSPGKFQAHCKMFLKVIR